MFLVNSGKSTESNLVRVEIIGQLGTNCAHTREILPPASNVPQHELEVGLAAADLSFDPGPRLAREFQN